MSDKKEAERYQAKLRRDEAYRKNGDCGRLAMAVKNLQAVRTDDIAVESHITLLIQHIKEVDDKLRARRGIKPRDL